MVCPDDAAKQHVDSERNQGRAPDMSWLDHDRLGFNYRLDDLSCALGIAQLERLDELLAARAGGDPLQRGARGGRGARAAARAGGDRRSWFVYVVQLPAGVDRDAAVMAMRARGRHQAVPACHPLMSFYRERFGHREGEFPARGRGAPLPGAALLPQLTDGEVDQVAGALRDVLAGSRTRPRRRLGSGLT